MARWLVLNEDGRVHEALNLDMVDHIDFAYHARDPQRLAEVTLYIRGRKPLHLSDDEHMHFVLDQVTAVPAVSHVDMAAAAQPAPPPAEAPAATAAAAPAEQAPPAAAPRKPRTTRRPAAEAQAPAQSEPADVPAAAPPKPRQTRRRSASAEPA